MKLSHFLNACALVAILVPFVARAASPANTTKEQPVAKTVEFLGDRGFASDGLESDDKGRLYLTNYEDNAILRRDGNGLFETLVCDTRALWPDTMSLAADGHLYFTANQLHRQKQFHEGKDLRRKPYVLFRLKVDAGPVLLRREK